MVVGLERRDKSLYTAIRGDCSVSWFERKLRRWGEVIVVFSARKVLRSTCGGRGSVEPESVPHKFYAFECLRLRI